MKTLMLILLCIALLLAILAQFRVVSSDGALTSIVIIIVLEIALLAICARTLIHRASHMIDDLIN